MKHLGGSYFAIAIAAMALALGSGCDKERASAPAAVTNTNNANVVAQENASVNAAGMSLLEYKITKNAAGATVIKGNISNSSDKKISFAEVSFKLFNKAGKEVGTATTSVNNLEAKFSWIFEMPITPEDAASAQLAGITTK